MMASIFTFDPDPPRVSSPWGRDTPLRRLSSLQEMSPPVVVTQPHLTAHLEVISKSSVTRLEAEPQEGPTEYKLHLLLRPRASLSFTTTGKHISGSQHSRSLSANSRNLSEAATSSSAPPPPQNSTSSRQHRLEQLTTQLLWRLQQSSPYHSSSASNLILPKLPEATIELEPPNEPARLLPGLEESKGALYEIGVSDDGSFVGLTMDEMNESMNNLRAMAASLGCSVEVLRLVPVGRCEWYEKAVDHPTSPKIKRAGDLFVAEAFVKPELDSFQSKAKQSASAQVAATGKAYHSFELEKDSLTDFPPTTEQLRVSLTGATTCGKSSLLGTLTTSTLDNGRGKSRLTLLRHRHEIATGMTSSVAQELIGYHTRQNGDVAVVNYAAENIASWNEIHASSKNGRLVFVSDSAGHPRYRRTTVRGLVSWAPHWTLLCIAANGGMDVQKPDDVSESDSDRPRFEGTTAHLSIAHLELCLRLKLPLLIVVTKFDVATRSSFRQILSTVLTILKDSGRRPIMLSNDKRSLLADDELQLIPETEIEEAQRIARTMHQSDFRTVPILFTSSVSGMGITQLHALLRHLPVSFAKGAPVESLAVSNTTANGQQSCLFHIDDVFNFLTNRHVHETKSQRTIVLSGHLKTGELHIGGKYMLGPFSSDGNTTLEEATIPNSIDGAGPFLSPRSFNDALARATASGRLRTPSSTMEWREVTITSIRNLRLPVRTLGEDQAGTVGVMSSDPLVEFRALEIRKGMILTNGPHVAAHSFTATFDVADAGSFVVGCHVVVYSGSVRASAKVIALASAEDQSTISLGLGGIEDGTVSADNDSEDGFGFNMDEELEQAARQVSLDTGRDQGSISGTFQFFSQREWLALGAQILVMPGNGPMFPSASNKSWKGFGTLEGFVGYVTEKFS